MATKDTKGGRASRVLHRHRRSSPAVVVEQLDELGRPIPPPPPVSAAASKLARRLLTKKGRKHLVEIGSRGGTTAWRDLSPLERSIEMRRRRRLGISRRKAVIAERIKQQLGK